MRPSLLHLTVLFQAMIMKSLACGRFDGLTRKGNSGNYRDLFVTLVNNGATICTANALGAVPLEQQFVFLDCLPSYLATFDWHTSTLWYDTPYESGASFGLSFYEDFLQGLPYDHYWANLWC
jgi:hypothetical protein